MSSLNPPTADYTGTTIRETGVWLLQSCGGGEHSVLITPNHKLKTKGIFLIYPLLNYLSTQFSHGVKLVTNCDKVYPELFYLPGV